MPRLRTELAPVSLLSTLLALMVLPCPAQTNGWRGRQFTSWTKFDSFTAKSNATGVELLSPVVTNAFVWHELIASWNVELPRECALKIEVRAFRDDVPTKFYTLGLWTGDPTRQERTSLAGQKDDEADVATDTLILRRPAGAFQLRLTLGPGTNRPSLKFLTAAVTDTRQQPASLKPNRAAWGKTLAVPERSQMPYPNGVTLCSPATVAMLLEFWARKLDRPELTKPVPVIAEQVYDAAWQGSGNWSFNMAYAGSLPGLRACVTRFSDLSEIEDWVAADFPVGLSVCYNRLRDASEEPSGHLVVCVGFTKSGDPIVNDPGTALNVRKIFPRQNLARAWAYSKSTVYLTYPDNAMLPYDRFGHW